MMSQFDQPRPGQDGATSTAAVLLEARLCSKVFETEGKHQTGAQPMLVLDKIQFLIHEGEFVALLVSSGSGKSTLLRFLACLLTPSSGQVLFMGVLKQVPKHRVACVVC